MKVQILARRNAGGIKKPSGLKILTLPKTGKHNFRADWLQSDGIRQFLTMADELITLHTVDGDKVFNIDYRPGRHCLTCGEKLPDAGADPYAEQCRAHVETHGAKAKKTERWPHGYIATKSYMTTLQEG